MLCAVGPSDKRALVAVVDPQVRAQVHAALGPYFDSESLLDAVPPADLLERVIAAVPDLAFVDADFPGFGSAMLEQLRTRRGLEGLYLVVLAGPDRLMSLMEHSGYCADDLLLAPLREVELAARIRMAVSRVLARHERRQHARKLEDLNQRQREFLSVVSHEIRTPLSAIMSSANILRRYGRERPDSVEKFATVIQQEGRRLTRLINNLLDLAKIEAGEVEWKFAPTAVEEVISLVRDSFAALAGERRLELAVEAADAPLEVELDRDKIIQVLVNLLSNAVKHSPEGSSVTLRCTKREGGGVRFEVEDQGPGIPPGQEERIFERFQQLEVGDERTGTGLGLTISREIVERHSGRIWATSAPRGGALFVVELPARAGHGPV